MAADSRPAFERFCRQKGTRINAIMTRLERGESNEAIAERYKTKPDVIRVYRLALEDKLASGGREWAHRPEQLKVMVVFLALAGDRAAKIATKLDVPIGTIRQIMRDKGIKPRRANEADKTKKKTGKSKEANGK